MADSQGFLKPELLPIEPPIESALEQKVEISSVADVAIESPIVSVEAPRVEDSAKLLQASATIALLPVTKDELQTEIEAVMSKDLTDVFLNLPENTKEDFRIAGEEASSKIKIMIETGKIKVKRILEIIRDWLRIIPGVNKFFLEQEAKIKTDAILKIIDRKEKNVIK